MAFFVKVCQTELPRNLKTDSLFSARLLVLIRRRMEVFFAVWSFLFLIFEEFHPTKRLIHKRLELSVGLLGLRQNQGEIRQYHGFLESEASWFLF